MIYKMRIIKMNALGNKEAREFLLPGLDEILSPTDVFMLEHEMNKILYLRVHIEEYYETTESNPK